MALLTTVWIADINFVSGIDSAVWPASLKKRTTASARKAVIMTICLHTVFLDLVIEPKGEDRILVAGSFLDTIRFAMDSNVFSPCSPEGGLYTSSNIVSNDWGTVVRFWTACAALDAAVIWRPLPRICSRMLTVVASSSRSPREVFTTEFNLMEKLKWKLREGEYYQGKN